MAKKVLLLHGWGGSDYPHWQSWLAGELAKDYGCVNFLKFSDFDRPKLAVWLRELKDELEAFKPDIVICHSLANTLWFHLCNREFMTPIEQLFLVAPPSNECAIEELSEFFPVQTPLCLYAKNAMLVTSTNDPYMTQEEAINLQKTLDVKMKVIENGGHLNADSGYGEWKWMLNEVSQLTH